MKSPASNFIRLILVAIFALLLPSTAQAEEKNDQNDTIEITQTNIQLQHTGSGGVNGRVGRVLGTGSIPAGWAIEYNSGKSPVQWTKDNIRNIELNIKRQAGALYKQAVNKYILYNYTTNRVSWGCIPGQHCLAPTSGELH
ncbi:hypothetical protein [Shouchella miscanthi]|uniref:Uncharacterized protein n=1 Tax=Shouchella miscanthi TaxID=2598861 RepID=A0ABU6NRE7_9BACI|nr:hypothetical protein [Shouchella miscanthi]